MAGDPPGRRSADSANTRPPYVGHHPAGQLLSDHWTSRIQRQGAVVGDAAALVGFAVEDQRGHCSGDCRPRDIGQGGGGAPLPAAFVDQCGEFDIDVVDIRASSTRRAYWRILTRLPSEPTSRPDGDRSLTEDLPTALAASAGMPATFTSLGGRSAATSTRRTAEGPLTVGGGDHTRAVRLVRPEVLVIDEVQQLHFDAVVVAAR